MIWGAVLEEPDPLSACLPRVSRDLRGVPLLPPPLHLFLYPLTPFLADILSLPCVFLTFHPFLSPPPLYPLCTSLFPLLSVILIFSKTSFPELWELADSEGHCQTDSSHHKQLVGVGMPTALHFQTSSFWQVIFFIMLIVIFPVIVFLPYDFSLGCGASVWDQAILLSGPENKDDSNKKESQLLFHFISAGKSGWGRNKGAIIIIKFKKKGLWLSIA